LGSIASHYSSFFELSSHLALLPASVKKPPAAGKQAGFPQGKTISISQEADLTANAFGQLVKIWILF
jgi:hypothetical protein